MTIASGFRCSDGVVLTADTEYTWGEIQKSYGPKIFPCATGPSLKVVLTGAGAIDNIELLAQRLAEALPSGSTSFEQVRAVIEKTATEIRKKYIYPHLAAGEQYEFDFVIALWIPGHKARLLKLVKTALIEIGDNPPYVFKGTGLYLATYLAKIMNWQRVDTKEAEMMAIQILRAVKGHVPGCGGDTQCYVVRDSGDLRGNDAMRVTMAQDYFAEFEGLLGAAMTTAVRPDSDEDVVDTYLKLFREVMVKYLSRFKNRQVNPVTTKQSSG